MTDYLMKPDPDDPRLTEAVRGVDQEGRAIETRVTVERPLTLFLNGQEIVTMMTIGDYPNYLAVGFLRNQGMLQDDDEVTAIDYDDDLDVAISPSLASIPGMMVCIGRLPGAMALG